MIFGLMRPQITNDRTFLSKSFLQKPLLKSKIKGITNKIGKDIFGRLVSYHKGGGHKKSYRKIEFKRDNDSIGIVTSIEYDPCRTGNIAAVYKFMNQSYSYILAPKNLRIGDIIKSGLNGEIKLGHSLPITKVPIGSYIYNVASKMKGSGQIARSAGTFAQLVEKNIKFGLIKMSSTKYKILPLNCYVTLGTVSNELSCLKKIKKAGRARWLNKRPIVRGVAMNPIDHPHGGGEGKKSGLKLSPWGKRSKKIYQKKNVQ
jgi:large subunit ribosomal protein L2